MKHTFIHIILCLSCITSMTQAQLGINAGYLNEKIDQWQTIHTLEGYSIGLSYKIPILKEAVKIEPTIAYILNGNKRQITDNEFSDYVSISIPIYLYPFRLGYDCDCPTIEKGNIQLYRNIYLGAFPLLLSNTQTIANYWLYTYNSFDLQRFFIGIGLGIDIPLTQRFVISPQVAYYPWNINTLLTRDSNHLNYVKSNDLFQLSLSFRITSWSRHL